MKNPTKNLSIFQAEAMVSFLLFGIKGAMIVLRLDSLVTISPERPCETRRSQSATTAPL